MAKPKKKTGRPAIEPPTGDSEMRKLFNYCLLGATNDDLAKYYGVGSTTIGKWISDYPIFAATLKSARDEADAKVVKSLYQRAIGYSHKAVKIFYDSKKRGYRLKPGIEEHLAEPDDYIFDDGAIVVEYVEHYPPSEIAAFFWLKNRQKERWREKQEIDTTLSGKVDIGIDWTPAGGCKPLKQIEEIEKEAAAEEERLNNANNVDNGPKEA